MSVNPVNVPARSATRAGAFTVPPFGRAYADMVQVSLREFEHQVWAETFSLPVPSLPDWVVEHGVHPGDLHAMDLAWQRLNVLVREPWGMAPRTGAQEITDLMTDVRDGYDRVDSRLAEQVDVHDAVAWVLVLAARMEQEAHTKVDEAREVFEQAIPAWASRSPHGWLFHAAGVSPQEFDLARESGTPWDQGALRALAVLRGVAVPPVRTGPVVC